MINLGKNKLRIVNMVASADLGVEIEIDRLAREAENVEYEPEQFPGAIIRYSNPGTTVLLFRNGRIVIVGSRSEKDIKQTIDQLVNDLNTRGVVKNKVVLDGDKVIYRIPNYVALGEMGFAIDLDALLENQDLNLEYEPEQFPGIMLWIDKYNSTALVFRNGKVILSGNRDIDSMNKSFNYLKDILNRYRIKDNS
ncbi:MAG: hypothetical protein NZ908_03130 [Candidatus Micrarchaeota archaeon]|nr:hypothetical protein [Candidatus Micrarchaeota archaeon]MCX8154348.1 hypothetical protein [Candidatus Micrarchaeota archaeon]